jgi:hypothetical protein
MMNLRSLFLFGALALLAGCFTISPLRAQDDGGGRRLAFLSAADRAHLLKVRQQVLDTHPDLKAEQDSLEQERKSVKDKGTDATADDKKTLFQNMMAHGKKMQDAMRQADPTIGPVLDQIDAKMKERMQSKAADGSGT